MRYAMVIDKAEGNNRAYVPALPGCVVTGATAAGAQARMRQAIAPHPGGLRENGSYALAPEGRIEYVEGVA